MIRSSTETLYRLSNLNEEQQRISYQMSSTKILQYGSDDANLFTRDIYLDDKIKVYEGIELQIEKTTAQNTVSDSTLDEVKDLLTYIKQEVIKANTSTVDQDAREAIAVNLRGVKENEVLVRVGAYKPGMDKELDDALAKKEKIRTFLTQGMKEQYNFNEILNKLKEVFQ